MPKSSPTPGYVLDAQHALQRIRKIAPPADSRPVNAKLIGGALVVAFLLVGVAAYRKHQSSAAGIADAKRVRDCLQAAGRAGLLPAQTCHRPLCYLV